MRATSLFFWESHFTNTLTFKVCTCSWGGLHQHPFERSQVFPSNIPHWQGLVQPVLEGTLRAAFEISALLSGICLVQKYPPISCLVVWLTISWEIQNLTDCSWDILVSCCPVQVSAWASEFCTNLNKLLHRSNIHFLTWVTDIHNKLQCCRA